MGARRGPRGRPAAHRPARRSPPASPRPSPPGSPAPTGHRRGRHGSPSAAPPDRRLVARGQADTLRRATPPPRHTPPPAALRVGCSGWMYDSWCGRMYPEREPKRRWLELYAQRFDTVEVNSTFYRLARRDAVAGWVAQTPPGFTLAVKASRYLTHIKRLAGIEEGIKRFYEPIEPLIEAGRLGPVLWQLPENFHRDDARLAGLLAVLPAGEHTIEFRHRSWFEPEVMAML